MSEAEQSPESAAPAVNKGKPAGGKALGVVAALLALAAIGAAGYVWLEVQKLQVLPGQVQAEAGATERLRSELEQRLDSLGARVNDEAAATAELQTAVTAEVAAVAELSLQLEQMDARVNALSGTDRAQRSRFLQAEALYYLRVANARALLASDARVAAQALQLADNKLREAGDPALIAVREQLSREIAALKALPQVDLAGIAFKLQSLATQVGDWPLRNPAPQSFSSELPAVAEGNAAGEAGAWSRLKATVVGVFKSIVKVRENTERPEVQLSNAQHALVVESVRAELQLARLAFVTGEFGLFEQSLARVDAQIRGYFDLDNSAVEAALEAVAELAGTERPAGMPDISGSLSLLLKADGNSDDSANGAQ